MPALVRNYPSVSPWNVGRLTLADYGRLLHALAEEAQAVNDQ